MRVSLKPPIARRWGWMTTARPSAMRRMWRPIRICFPSGRRCSSSRRVSRPADMPLSAEHPQGAKRFNGKTHQVFGVQNISQVQGGKLMRVHQTTIEDGLYDDTVDYTTMAF